MANYKPYSPEWNRKRYLKEAIQSYFHDDVEPTIIVGDIFEALSEQFDYYQGRANKLNEVMADLYRINKPQTEK
jgi:hypothetical protein|tara:strand:+ start:2674 stop:2895 length:222 start_codon:yes stop_codon:yes gene_type:complete